MPFPTKNSCRIEYQIARPTSILHSKAHLLRHRTTLSDKARAFTLCDASGGYAFRDPSLQGGIRRCASTAGIRSARARPRRVRGGSCAPNAMPPFAPPCGHFASLVRSIALQSARVPSETLRVSAAHLASLESASLPPPADTFLHVRTYLPPTGTMHLWQDMQSRERRRFACFMGRPA